MHQSRRNDQKKLDLLDNKLAAYATAAGALLANSNPAEAAIQYAAGGGTLDHNYNPFYVSAIPITMISGGGSPFNVFLYRTGGAPGSGFNSAWVTASSSYSFLGMSTYAFPLPANYVISQGAGPWTSWSGPANLAGFVSSGYAPVASTGGFLGTTAYLGLRFDVGGTIHYGWCQINISANCKTVNILGTAWEDTPGLGILAGEQDNSLAVSLMDFTAEHGRKGISLNWSTASEVDHAGFIIERKSLDAEDASWEVIASYETMNELAGIGNRSEQTDYVFTDHNTHPGESYAYRLIAVDTHGVREMFESINVSDEGVIPDELTLNQNYPNPFNPSTTIAFGLPETGKVTLRIFNVEGQTVETLVDEELPHGPHQIEWQANNLPAGVYFYELQTEEARIVKKMNLIK